MRISVTWGVGTGSTKLSSFDQALWDAGVANYNLIPLSSVIPPETDIVIKKARLNNSGQDFGKRLYVVMSRMSATRKGDYACAGVGWVMNKKKKKGLFVEHHGHSETEVHHSIIASLTDMVKYREDKFGKIKYKITGIEFKDKPVTALVCAIYKVENW